MTDIQGVTPQDGEPPLVVKMLRHQIDRTARELDYALQELGRAEENVNYHRDAVASLQRQLGAWKYIALDTVAEQYLADMGL